MHLIAAMPGGWSPNQEGVTYVDQSPGDVVFLSASDTEIATFARAYKTLHQAHPGVPVFRLANLGHFRQELTVDTYVEQVLSKAKLIIMRALGGKGYFSYLVERVQELGRQGISVIFLPGHDSPDHELVRSSTVDRSFLQKLWQYFLTVHEENAGCILQLLWNECFGFQFPVKEPLQAADIFLYHPTTGMVSTEDAVAIQAQTAIIAYRAHYLSGNLDPIYKLMDTLGEQGIPAVVIFVQSLREAYQVNELLQVLEQLKRYALNVIIKTTGFSIRQFDQHETADFIYSKINVPVIQAIHASTTYEAWKEGTFGLSPTDIAMNIALPELDGRIITRPISFKKPLDKDRITDSGIVMYEAFLPGCRFVSRFARHWLKLTVTSNSEKRIALILPNYPSKDSRLANGVGLDTPQSAVEIIQALAREGYQVGNYIPGDSAELMTMLSSRITNELSTLHTRPYQVALSREDFEMYYNRLSPELRSRIEAQWGSFDDDPYFDGTAFALPGIHTGNLFISIQPSRGYHIDVPKTYHSPDLPPTYSYFAFYFWLQHIFDADAVIHLGKHGNLEWLPGKSLALDDEHCFPAAIFGAVPHFYPFIINDPGEGSQAKRRNQAVIIDHLIPPMTRAETYGVLIQLENLIDEYYEAFYADPKRTRVLRKEIEKLVDEHHLKKDLGIESDDLDELLVKLDGYLCEIKEAQIRDGLHIFGKAPAGDQLVDLLIALHRLPADGMPGITQALAKDTGLSVDPLNIDYTTSANIDIDNIHCRTYGDVVAQLEAKAKTIITDTLYNNVSSGNYASHYPQTAALVVHITDVTMKKIRSTGDEIQHLLKGLNGEYVPAGGSGAPTRSRLDILPTGRNFYSIDVRTVPTEAAYRVGTRSAEALIQRYLQEHGEYPQTIGLSVWGTSTMRTGGDDIAQAMALMGVKPVWQNMNRRVADFEIIPLFRLKRPRIDVMLRISGFFRDAFPDIISLYNAIVEKVASLEEDDEDNYIRKRVRKDEQHWASRGYVPEQATQMSLYRVFGSKPGAYGAGLQALIDGQAWKTTNDLAAAYMEWSSYAYDKKARGISATKIFRNQLSHIQVVMQNQDNREHDILDSDDYYQFQGGMASAVAAVTGEQPSIYFGDHARPDNPRVKTLKEELLKVYRSRVVNPKWIDGVKRHGYKGAFEMAATLDYLFAYDATTSLVEDFMYEGIAQAYLLDESNRDFIEKANPWALRDMSERLLEAIQRGMWQSPSAQIVEQLKGIYIAGEE